jgi:hypothetical protein
MNTARYLMASFGLQTSAVAGGGASGSPLTPTGATELWDGTSWTTNPNSMGTARYNLGGTGTQSFGLAFAGNPGPAVTNVTEEWTGPGAPLTQTITVS